MKAVARTATSNEFLSKDLISIKINFVVNINVEYKSYDKLAFS